MTSIPLKITSWILRKGIKLIRSLKVNLVPLSLHPRLNKLSWEMVELNIKLCSMLLKLNLPMSGTLILRGILKLKNGHYW